MSDNTQTTALPGGGGIRVSFGGGDPESAASNVVRDGERPGVQTRVVGGAITSDGKGGITQMRHSSQPNPHSANVMDTLRSPGGRSNVSPQDITPDCTIWVDGVQTSVGSALALGWVRRTANGLEFTGQAQADKASIAAAQAAHDAPEVQSGKAPAPTTIGAKLKITI